MERWGVVSSVARSGAATGINASLANLIGDGRWRRYRPVRNRWVHIAQMRMIIIYGECEAAFHLLNLYVSPIGGGDGAAPSTPD